MMDDLRELYQEVILDHGKNPRNFRHPADANRAVRGSNPLCGDQLTVYLRLGEDGVVEDLAFEGKGCAISMASASMMTEMVRGMTIARARALFETFHKMVTGETPKDGADDGNLEKLRVLSGVRDFPMRVKCATLAWHALNAGFIGETNVTTE